MSHYDFCTAFRKAYDQVVRAYVAGAPDARSLTDKPLLVFLEANGLSAQAMYDYAEDDRNGGEPGFERALAIELVRRDYFLNVQEGKPSGRVIDPAALPAKTEAVAGIAWLPRLIPKARAKLRGELPPSLMYSCAGDRAFFRSHDLHPAEFLSLVWRHEGNDQAVVDRVVARLRAACAAGTLRRGRRPPDVGSRRTRP
jgi:hypothetical protein